LKLPNQELLALELVNIHNHHLALFKPSKPKGQPEQATNQACSLSPPLSCLHGSSTSIPSSQPKSWPLLCTFFYPALKQTCLQRGASCVQKLDDSQIHANRTTYRTLLRSSLGIL